MDRKNIKKSKQRLLLNAEPFGFGPAAAIASFFPYLKKFRVDDPNTIEYKIGEIFHELKNKIQSGYSLRNILDTVDKLHFQTDKKEQVAKFRCILANGFMNFGRIPAKLKHIPQNADFSFRWQVLKSFQGCLHGQRRGII